MENNIISFNAPVNSWGKDVQEKKNFGNKIALIDADYFKYVVTARMYHKMMDEGLDAHSKLGLNEIIDAYLGADIFNQFECKAYVFCFSAPSKNTFRHAVAQEKKYKGNREGKVDKYFYDGKYEDMAYVFEYINKRYPTLFFDDLEADDILGMVQNDDTFIYSNDKDLKQVVGWHYNMDRRILDYIDEDLAISMLMDQLVTGDAVDNVPGIKGFGPKALDQFREECFHMESEQVMWLTVKKYINKYGLLAGMDTFVEMWVLLSMKMNRGEWFREKYSKAFVLIDELIKQK